MPTDDRGYSDHPKTTISVPQLPEEEGAAPSAGANVDPLDAIGAAGIVATEPVADAALIRTHIKMVCTLAEAYDGGGKLSVTAFGEDPDQGDPKTGKPGVKLRSKILHFVPGGSIDGIVEWIEGQTRLSNYNVYTGLAVYRSSLRASSRGAAKDIVAVLGVVADFDDAEASRWQERLPLPPQYVLETSAGRFQCFYLFDEPHPAEAVHALAKRLKTFAGCDHGTADLNHVWRIAGTLNWPNAKKIAEGRAREPQPVVVVKE
jgi:RepB DNA-primase from phage plasmid